MYTGPVEPGSTHDLTAARLHVLPALYRSAWLGMPVLADKGYQGAGIGVLTPTKNPRPTPDEQTRNNLLSALRAPAERANAMFKHFRALQRVSLDPATITTIMAAALVIITLWHDSWKVILGVSQVISGGDMVMAHSRGVSWASEKQQP